MPSVKRSLEPPQIALDDLFMLDRPRAEDAAAHRRFAVDPDAARFFGWTVEQARTAPDSHYREVVRRFSREWETGARLSFSIRRRSDGEAVGMVELRPQPGDAEAEVSYLVTQELRGGGLATRALAAVLDWAAHELSLRKAILHCHVDNVASRRVAEKCGFVLVGRSGDELRFRRELVPPETAPAADVP
jgi:RimJ/RimL family protein N-acetyltransferase